MQQGMRKIPRQIPEGAFRLTPSERETLKRFDELRILWGYPGDKFEHRSEEEGRIYLQNYTDILFRGLHNLFGLNYSNGFSHAYDVLGKLGRQDAIRHVPITCLDAGLNLLKEFFDNPRALKLVKELSNIPLFDASLAMISFKLSAIQILLLYDGKWDEAYVLGKWMLNE